ncbi:WNT6 [Cordylochernes scorpioides]|uniref:Protein Wnt n=1 Tax=Cordylochernes scorpioides TaxID=51811 RepID=A0ABY6LLG8_9ARAC|nr:WNT6 [Cordylochernes scorpioides]
MSRDRPTLLDPARLCRKQRALRAQDRASICREEPAVIRALTRGANLALRECQFQFRHRRWNCSAARRSLRKVLLRDTREAGFLNAVAAAGMSWAVAEACGRGRVACPCQRPPGDWAWAGCGDNLEVGEARSKPFLLEAPRGGGADVRASALRHNYEAGRIAVRRHIRRVCKCHGMSGSCTLQSCWRKLPSFRTVGAELKARFDGASKVTAGNDGSGFVPVGGPSLKPPGPSDLVYLEDSPNYCEPDRRAGSLGTRHRLCNHSSAGVEGCDLLCCGRGYQTSRMPEKVHCQCRFHWCCEVVCSTCTRVKLISRCL